MPIEIQNNHANVSLADIVDLREQGYSVLKSPHVGNQHPSNLVCAALGIPMEMVSFTQGERDVNFHPHVKIKDGVATPLYDGSAWTQFATIPDGRSATEYHQSAAKCVFPQTDIFTDTEIMRAERDLTEVVLRQSNAAIKQLWYRRVSSTSDVMRVTDKVRLTETELETDVFQISNAASGWITPNRVHILFDFAWQSLSSGRDTIYHLAGPQMAGYIGGLKSSLGAGYDAIRGALPQLPETLIVRVVPVASCRFVTLQTRSDSLAAVQDVVSWYESLPSAERRYANDRFAEVLAAHPEFVTPIETATTLSQHDLVSADCLLLDPWMLHTPLSRVEAIYQKLVKAHPIAVPKQAA